MTDHMCHLCGDSTCPIQTRQRREFRHCPHCDLVSVPRQWHLSEVEARARYLQHNNTLQDAGYVTMLRRPIDLLQQHTDAVHRVLDYGSGPSPVMVELLGQAGYEAVGYDPIYATSPDISRPFDAVISVETFEHFAMPHRELDRIVGLLQPGGHLAVMTQLHGGPDTFADWWYARDPTHIAFWSSATFAWVEKAFDLQLIDTDGKQLVLMRR